MASRAPSWSWTRRCRLVQRVAAVGSDQPARPVRAARPPPGQAAGGFRRGQHLREHRVERSPQLDVVGVGQRRDDRGAHVLPHRVLQSVPGELAKGFGFYQSKPATGFSPVAITPDELRDVWHDGQVHRPLISHINGKRFGSPNAGVDMTFDFRSLIAHAARTRRLGTGTIVGSGTISNLEILRYLNRLSSLLFIMARAEDAVSGEAPIQAKTGTRE